MKELPKRSCCCNHVHTESTFLIGRLKSCRGALRCQVAIPLSLGRPTVPGLAFTSPFETTTKERSNGYLTLLYIKQHCASLADEMACHIHCHPFVGPRGVKLHEDPAVDYAV